MKMKLFLGALWLSAANVAHAGFLFETAPIKPPSVPKSSAVKQSDAQPAGRNIDSSAKLDRVTRMNRQRIDLESKLTSRITQTGEQPDALPIVRGMGRDVTLEDALRQILPAGWSAYSDQDMPLNQRVSWNGSRSWPHILHSVLVDLDMRANVDWRLKEVMFFVPAPKEQLTLPVSNAPGVEVRAVGVAPALAASAATGGSVSPSTAPAPVQRAQAQAKIEPAKPAVVPEVVWKLSPDHMLRENIRRWAAAANWTLVWNAVQGDRVIDYPVDAAAEYTGELIGVSGAIARVISAYYDADYPLEVEFFRGNKVVEVRLHKVNGFQPGDLGNEGHNRGRGH